MTEDRVEWHLWNWSQWMYGARTMRLQMPSRASGGMGRSHRTDVDAMIVDADLRCAEATDAAIDDLPELHKKAVYAKHLGGDWPGKYLDSVRGMLYGDAKKQIGRKLDRLGIA